MIRRAWAISIAVCLLIAHPALAKSRTDADFAFPVGQSIKVVVFRPDVQVGSLNMGGLEEPNAEWTATARDRLVTALKADDRINGTELRFLSEQEGEKGRLVADYQALFRAVAAAIVSHQFYGGQLPTKKDRFDWTLGPEATKLREIGGGDYALFIYAHDSFGSAGRKTAQLLLAVAGVGIQAGIHNAYSALVDLKTGKIVWFNVLLAAGGDPRTEDGASKRLDRLLTSFPPREGATASAK